MAKKTDGLESAAAPRVSGTQWKGVHQAAIEAQDRLRAPYQMDEPWNAREADYDAVNKVAKRGRRGGSVFSKSDMTG